MKKPLIALSTLLFCSCNSTPTVLDEYKDVLYERCINATPAENQDKNRKECVYQSYQATNLARIIHKRARAESDLQKCSGENITNEAKSSCYSQRQRDFYEMWFKIPSRDPESFRLDGAYQLDFSSGWLVQEKSDPIRRLYEVEEPISSASNEQTNVKFAAQKHTDEELFLLRIVTTPADISASKFEKLSGKELEMLTSNHIKNRRELYNAGNVKMHSSSIKKSDFKGIPALKSEMTIEASNGDQYWDIEYTIYRDSITHSVGIAQLLDTPGFSREKSEEILRGITILK